jgi:CHAT domain-containing protein
MRSLHAALLCFFLLLAPSFVRAQTTRDLLNQGVAAAQAKSFAPAEIILKEAMQRARTGQNPGLLGDCLNALGTMYLETNRLGLSIPLLIEAIQVYESIDAWESIATSALNLGQGQNAAQRFKEAEKTLGRAVTLLDQAGKIELSCIARQHQITALRQLGRYSQGLVVARRLLSIRKAGKQPNHIAETQGTVGMMLAGLNKVEEAEAAFAAGEAICEGEPELVNSLAIVRLRRGYALRRLGKIQESRQLLKQAAHLAATKDPEFALTIYTTLIDHCMEAGDFGDAAVHSQAARVLAERTGQQKKQAQLAADQGGIWLSLGQPTRALKALLEAHEALEDVRDVRTALQIQANVGHALMQLREFELAAELFRDSIETGNDVGFLGGLGADYASLGQALNGQRKYAEALESLRVAEQAFPRECVSIGNILVQESTALLGLGRLAEARETARRAEGILQKVGTTMNRANVLRQIGTVEVAQGNWNGAIEPLRAAIGLVQGSRTQVADASRVGQFEGQRLEDAPALLALALQHLGKPEEALLTLEKARAQGVLRQAAWNRQSFDTLLSKEDSQKLTTAREKLAKLSAQQRAFGELPPQEGSSEFVDLETARATAAQELSRLLDELGRSNPRFARQTGLTPASLDELKAIARRTPDARVLLWAIGPQKESLLLSVDSKGTVQGALVPLGRDALRAQVDRWRTEIEEQQEAEYVTARDLYEKLIVPVEKLNPLGPEVKRLVLLGDGPLLELPFAAMVMPSGKRLIQRFALSTGFSLGALVPDTTARPRASLPILTMADPGGGIAGWFDGLAALPDSRAEAIAIDALFPDGKLLLGEKATAKAIRADIGKARLLHFSTHGALSDEDGLLSGLLIAPESEADEELPLLMADEIAQTPLCAELAVLSACETGRGEQAGGEGLLGLTWAFRAAGCPSVLSSLWSVEDKATSQLMVRFYKELKAGKRKDDALKIAMGTFLESSTTVPPMLWAGFQLSGDAGPLSPERGSP